MECQLTTRFTLVWLRPRGDDVRPSRSAFRGDGGCGKTEESASATAKHEPQDPTPAQTLASRHGGEPVRLQWWGKSLHSVSGYGGSEKVSVRPRGCGGFPPSMFATSRRLPTLLPPCRRCRASRRAAPTSGVASSATAPQLSALRAADSKSRFSFFRKGPDTAAACSCRARSACSGSKGDPFAFHAASLLS